MRRLRLARYASELKNWSANSRSSTVRRLRAPRGRPLGLPLTPSFHCAMSLMIPWNSLGEPVVHLFFTFSNRLGKHRFLLCSLRGAVGADVRVGDSRLPHQS